MTTKRYYSARFHYFCRSRQRNVAFVPGVWRRLLPYRNGASDKVNLKTVIMQGGSFRVSVPPVTLNLIIINFLVWLAALTLPKFGIDLTQWLGLHFFLGSDFNVVQLFTYMFMHSTSSFGHIFFNMFSVYMFGRTLEMVWGGKRFLFYYLSVGLGAGIVQELWWLYEFWDIVNLTGDTMINIGTQLVTRGQFLNLPLTVGASGAAFGILLAFGMLFPNVPLYLMFIPVPIKAKYFVIFYGVAELFFGISGTMSGVAHFAHLGGMLFGFFLIRYWKKKGVGGGGNFF